MSLVLLGGGQAALGEVEGAVALEEVPGVVLGDETRVQVTLGGEESV